ncbi:M4 family metallopeptidase [Archangium violaceum]|uniref:M4 family metallopeptidase n=1 Tax=Archangium violaceum TaxID=83451 RepID=UPI00193BF408|nr:M4 family metallopeptidase [Archangium violaceum]QRK06319.1 M4 family metallopeptidase [Archangium violaceum]
MAESLSTLRAQKTRLGLNDGDDFRMSGAHTDRFGLTHSHFQQLHQGVPVWGAMAITHLDPSGRSLPVTADGLRTGIRMSTQPTVDAASAISLATLEISPRGLMGAEPSAELVIYPETRRVNLAPHKSFKQLNAADFRQEVVGYRLAWHVHVELDNPQDGIAHTDLLLDARSGEVLKKWSSLQTSAAIGKGNSQHNGSVQLNVWKNAEGLYELRDTTRALGEGLRTYDVNHADLQNGAEATLTLYTDPDNTWGDGANYVPGQPTLGDNGQTAAVDAHYGLQATWDYYLKIHGRLGIDNAGTPTFNRVHVSNLYNNAFWNSSCFCMSYGDGSYPGDPTGSKSLAALDVSAHELSHGVMSQTAALIYSGESGGLNEANSDIFGTMTEFWVRNGQGSTIGDGTKGNWFIGESLNPYAPMRYMHKPSLDGVSVDAWYPGIENIDVHFSSGPMNRAFYFLSQGADKASFGLETSSEYLPEGMEGIGNDKAAAIWYRAITVYMFPSANYLVARTASLRSAADLFGAASNEYRAVQNAFAAINVGYTANTYDDRMAPSVTASVSGTAPGLQLHALGTDNVGITRVEFLVDGAIVGTDSSLPFTVPLDTTTLSNGTHQLVVKAYDLAGNVGPSAPYSFNVANSFDQLLRDPGFEKAGEGWEADPRGNINHPVTGAHTGQGYVWLNGYGTVHVDNLYQDVTIPASAARASLTFYLELTTAEPATAARDTLVVQVRSTSGEVLETLATWSNLDATLGWVQRSFDLSAYAGQTVRIYLEGNEDATLGTSFKLDDFTLRVSGSADSETPSVTAQAVVVGGKVGLFANVSDNGHVDAVEFFLDGASVGTASNVFTHVVDASSLSNGAHTVMARAVDAAGNVGESALVAFFLDRNQQQRVLNPGFEDSTAAGQALWPITTTLTGSSRFFTNSSFAHTGARFFLFWSNLGPHTSSVGQTLTIPADSTSAIYSFWLRLHNSAFTDGEAHHTLIAKVRDSSGTALRTLQSFSNLDDTAGDYYEHRFDLSAYRGQTIQLVFEANQTEAPQLPDGVTQMFLDDVTLTTTSTPDTLAPQLTASVSGTYGKTVQLHAAVSDNVWTSRLEFSVDGNPVATRTDPHGSYTEPFDAADLTNGPHTLTVKAVDISGNESTAEVAFDIFNSKVEDVAGPTVSVGLEGMFETTVLKAEATDDTGVTAVEFYVDGAFKGRALAPPYTLPFSLLPLSPGEHTLEAVAYDAYGHSNKASTTFTSEAVSVSVGSPFIVVPVGGSATLTASVAHAVDTSFTWVLKEGRICGSLSADGVYTAPTATGFCHATATSTVAPGASATTTIKVFTGDLNGDHVVDGEDMGRMARAYGATDSDAPLYSEDVDLDASSSVDDNDVTLFVSQFGR